MIIKGPKIYMVTPNDTCIRQPLEKFQNVNWFTVAPQFFNHQSFQIFQS